MKSNVSDMIEFINNASQYAAIRLAGGKITWRQDGQTNQPLRMWKNECRKAFEAGKLDAIKVALLYNLGLQEVLIREVGGRPSAR